MRQLLMSMLLIVTVVMIYTSISQGEEGMQGQVTASGGGWRIKSLELIREAAACLCPVRLFILLVDVFSDI